MKIELGSNGLYQRYSEIRGTLPLFYCKEPFRYDCVEGGVRLVKTVDKGFYRCEDIGDGHMKVYDTYFGISMLKITFNRCFEKCNGLKTFLYRYFWWLWI